MQLYSVFSNPSFITYGMIGLTTVVLAALTVFDSADTTQDTNSTNESYVSQLFEQNEDEDNKDEDEDEYEYSQEDKQEQEQETGLISALTGGANKNRKKTKRHIRRSRRKTHHKK